MGTRRVFASAQNVDAGMCLIPIVYLLEKLKESTYDFLVPMLILMLAITT
jgi:hypothetical protein